MHVRTHTRVRIRKNAPKRRASMVNLNATGHEGRERETQWEEAGTHARTRVWDISVALRTPLNIEYGTPCPDDEIVQAYDFLCPALGTRCF